MSCSPHYLSRVFSQVTGSSVSAYRNRVLVSRAVTGHTPTACRGLL